MELNVSLSLTLHLQRSDGGLEEALRWLELTGEPYVSQRVRIMGDERARHTTMLFIYTECKIPNRSAQRLSPQTALSTVITFLRNCVWKKEKKKHIDETPTFSC